MPPPVRARAGAVGAATDTVSNVGLGALSLRSVAGSVDVTVTGAQHPERPGRLTDLPRPTVASN